MNKAATNSPKRQVWVAEDDEAMRNLLTVTFQRAGITVETFENGAEVLECARADNAGPALPDLMVLDHHMPEMHGLDVVERLYEELVDIPFIIITAYGDPETHARANALGAAAVFDKPFDLIQLRDLSVQLLNKA